MDKVAIEDYSAALEVQSLMLAPQLRGGELVKKNGRQIKYSGGFCVVFPFVNNGKKYALRCWHSLIDGIELRTKTIAEALRTSGLSYFISFEFIDEGIRTQQGVQPIVIMDWVDALTLKKYIALNLHSPSVLKNLAESFKKMVSELHKAHFAHGDLQHGNIMVQNNGSLILVDYDSMYVPGLTGVADEIKGLAGYQHPARWKNITSSYNLDYFSELIIYTSIIGLSKFPELWTKLDLEDSETMLFSAEDISLGGSSEIFSILSSDSETAELSKKIQENLKKNSLDELEPLENVLASSSTSIIDKIGASWTDNGYRKPQPTDNINLINTISRKF